VLRRRERHRGEIRTGPGPCGALHRELIRAPRVALAGQEAVAATSGYGQSRSQLRRGAGSPAPPSLLKTRCARRSLLPRACRSLLPRVVAAAPFPRQRLSAQSADSCQRLSAQTAFSCMADVDRRLVVLCREPRAKRGRSPVNAAAATRPPRIAPGTQPRKGRERACPLLPVPLALEPASIRGRVCAKAGAEQVRESGLRNRLPRDAIKSCPVARLRAREGQMWGLVLCCI